MTIPLRTGLTFEAFRSTLPAAYQPDDTPRTGIFLVMEGSTERASRPSRPCWPIG